MSEIIQGMPSPLFDRLSAESLSDGVGMLESVQDIQWSIQKELARLFNTRSNVPMAEFIQEECSVVDYGLPDFLSLSAQSGEDQLLMCMVLERAIHYYEPRLKNVKITITASDLHKSSALVRIVADAKIEAKDRRVEFEIALDQTHNRQKAV